jgi:hypothetical protein
MVLFLCAFLLIMLASMAALFVRVNQDVLRERGRSRAEMSAFYAAESAVNEAVMDMRSSGVVDAGTEDVPRALGALRYWVEQTSLGSNMFSLLGTGTDGLVVQQVELVVRRVPDGLFQFAAFGEEFVLLDSDAFVDSYDSTVGTYAAQVEAGDDFANEAGDTRSNGDITLDANSSIHGDATPGFDNIVDDASPQSFVSGSTAPAEDDLVLEPIDVPVIALTGSIDLNSNDGMSLAAGTYHYSSVLVRKGTLTVHGPATLVIDDLELRSNCGISIDTSAGPVEIHGTGDFELRSNSSFASIAQHARDVSVYLSGDNIDGSPSSTIAWNSNASFVGAIYAPDADIVVESNFELFGAVIAERLTLNSNARLHFDEDLRFAGGDDEPRYETVAWRPIAGNQAATVSVED